MSDDIQKNDVLSEEQLDEVSGGTTPTKTPSVTYSTTNGITTISTSSLRTSTSTPEPTREIDRTAAHAQLGRHRTALRNNLS